MREDPEWSPSEFQIDPSRPIYEQFVEQIRADIAKGKLAPGRRLPSVRELAAAVRVNPNTVMRTYQDLEREKLIVTYRGQGTFVTDNDAIITGCKRAIAVDAVRKLQEVADSIGLSLEELLQLVKAEEGK